jgi:hypothetical protein
MADKTIVCSDCSTEFEFSEGEQNFYEEKGLFPPKRCKQCRANKRKQNASKEKNW